MTGAQQILLAGFAALCMVLPACRSTTTAENFELSPLIVSDQPLTSASYTAEYTQDGALPFTCEVLMRSNDMIRRNYTWKDETGADKKVSVIIRGGKAVKLEDGKVSDAPDSAAELAKFFAGVILASNTESGSNRSLFENLPGVESFTVTTDPESRRWTGLQVQMNGGREISSTFPEYRTVSGVTFPALILSSNADGAPVRCVVRDVKINPELPEELFDFPGSNG